MAKATVTANGSWKLKSKPDWATISPTSGGAGATEVNVTVATNTDLSARSGNAVFETDIQAKQATLALNQSGAAQTLSLDRSSIEIPATPTPSSVPTFGVISNSSWKQVIDGSEAWAAMTPQNGSGNNAAVQLRGVSYYYGRLVKSQAIKVSLTDGSIVVPLTVSKPGYGLYTTIDGQLVNSAITKTYQVTKAQTYLDVALKFNAKRVTISRNGGGTLNASIPASIAYTTDLGGSGTFASGTDISGDPGAGSLLSSTVRFSFPANTGAAKTCTFTVTMLDSDGDTTVFYITLNQAAGVTEFTAMGTISPNSDQSKWKLTVLFNPGILGSTSVRCQGQINFYLDGDVRPCPFDVTVDDSGGMSDSASFDLDETFNESETWEGSPSSTLDCQATDSAYICSSATIIGS